MINLNFSADNSMFVFRRVDFKPIVVETSYDFSCKEITFIFTPHIDSWILNGICFADLVEYIDLQTKDYINKPFDNNVLREIESKIIGKINDLIRMKYILFGECKKYEALE